MRRPARLRRLVIRVRPPGLPGSSGSTCCSSAALSSTTSARMPASRWRYNPVRADRSWGIWWPGTPNRRRKLSRTAAGSAGGWAGSGWKPRRLTNSVWSNGCSPASRCPACTASRVLPTPAMPSIAAITTAAPLPAPWVGGRPRFGEDHAQRLVPLRYVPGVRVQRPHHGDDQVNVDPPPTGPETVHDGGLLGQLAGRTAGIGPGRVDLVLDDLVRRIAGPDLERPQSLDQLVERARLPRVGQRHPRLDLLRRSHGQPRSCPRSRRRISVDTACHSCGLASGRGGQEMAAWDAGLIRWAAVACSLATRPAKSPGASAEHHARKGGPAVNQAVVAVASVRARCAAGPTTHPVRPTPPGPAPPRGTTGVVRRSLPAPRRPRRSRASGPSSSGTSGSSPGPACWGRCRPGAG